MSAGRGFEGSWSGQGSLIQIKVGTQQMRLTEEGVEALRLECEAALRQRDDERAAELHAIETAESSDPAFD